MRNKITAIIVDDESLARKDFLAIVKDITELEIIGEAGSLVEAKELAAGVKPKLVFLDIQLGTESGFDLLTHLTKETKVIFVTAYDEFAIKAFEVNAQDYLLKPVTRERVLLALERVTSDTKKEEYNKKLDYDDRLFLQLEGKQQFLLLENIIKIVSANDYSEITTTDGKSCLTSKTMKEWERRLPEKHFIRIHRSTIININYIEKIEDWFNYSFRVYLKGYEKPLVMSRRFASKVKERFG